MFRWFRPLSLPLLAVALGAVAAPASAAGPELVPNFPAPLALSAAGVISDFEPESVVALNRRGDGVAAWLIGKHGPTLNNDEQLEVQVAFHRGEEANAVWSAPMTVSQPGVRAGQPRVGIDARGVATVVWQEVGSGQATASRTRAITHSAAGLSPVQELSVAYERTSPRSVSLAVAPDGRAVVAYGIDGPADSPSVVAHQRATSDQPFGEPQIVSAPNPGREPATSISAGGHAVVAWVSDQIRVAHATAGGTFGPGVAASDLDRAVSMDDAWAPSIAVDGRGTATVLWYESHGNADTRRMPYEVVGRRVATDGVRSARQVIAAIPLIEPSDTTAEAASLGVDASGRVTAAWSTESRYWPKPTSLVQVATAPADSPFGPAVNLASPAMNARPVVAVDPSGTTAVGWGRRGATSQVAWRRAGADAFLPLLTPTPAWSRSVGLGFGRPDELTLAIDVDFAPRYVVQITTSTLVAPPYIVPPEIPDTTAPVVSVGKIEAVKAPRKKGTKQADRLVATFGSTEPVTVRSVVTQSLKGITRAGKCVKRPSNPKQRKGRAKCTMTVVVGAEVVAPITPSGSVLDLGKVPAKGSYTLTVKGTDAAGNVSAPVASRFTIR